MESILLDAKKEYTKQLVSYLSPAIYDELYGLWKNAVERNDKAPLRQYQELLETIVDWDESKRIVVTDRCIEKSGCSFIDDLLTAVFVAHTKVLMSIKNKSKVDSYKLQVPTSNRFVYDCIVHCARDFWKSPYLFYQNEAENKITKVQIQKNLRMAESMVKDAISDTVRGLLPIKDVLENVLETNENGGIVVEISKRKETLIKENSGSNSSVDREVTDNEPMEDEEVTEEQNNTDEISVTENTTEDVGNDDRVSEVEQTEQTEQTEVITTDDMIRNLQSINNGTHIESFKEANLGVVETNVDNIVGDNSEEDATKTLEDKGASGEGQDNREDRKTHTQGGEDEYEEDGDKDGGWDSDSDNRYPNWDNITMGPVDNSIKSMIDMEFEDMDSDKKDEESGDDILGAVEEL